MKDSQLLEVTTEESTAKHHVVSAVVSLCIY